MFSNDITGTKAPLLTFSNTRSTQAERSILRLTPTPSGTRSSTLTELTPYALRDIIKTLYVEAPDKSGGKRRQKVHIEYDLVGYIPVDELLKAEQA